jgi:two-component sensor histidine kinase
LFLLSEINNTKSHFYFKEYKKLKEQLIEKERQFKHQTSRIRYESDEKETEIRLQKIQVKSKNKFIFWITIASVIFAISSLLFFLQKRKIFKQKEAIKILQKEVHHTAKNNLYKTLSYISQTKENATTQSFLALENRVSSMLKLHEILYRTDHTVAEALQDYLQEICDMLHKSYADIDKEIRYQVQVDGVISYKEVELMGRITNELVTNIYKYAFVNIEKGFYSVNIKRQKKEVILIVRDDGVGFPKDFDLKSLKSYGMQMINGLIVHQLGGTFSIKKLENENEVLIKFKIQEK